MIYSPSFLYPDNISIDADNDNIFTWESAGDPQTDYQLFIRKVSDNTEIYNSTKLTFGSESHTVPSSTLTNGVDYMWMVKVWCDATTYAESEWVFFKANTTPTLEIDVFDNPLGVQNYLFTSTYTQAEDILPKRFKYVLYDDSDALVYESDWMYNTDIEYFITGMINGNSYQIECHVENQYGQVVISDKVAFTVSYEMPDNIPELILTPLDDIGAIKLEWTNIKQVLPVVTGTYDYTDGKFLKGLHLDSGSLITYLEPLPVNFTLPFFIKLDPSFVGVFLNIYCEDVLIYQVGYDGTRFYYQRDYRLTGGLPEDIPSDFILVDVRKDYVILYFKELKLFNGRFTFNGEYTFGDETILFPYRIK